MLPLPVLCELGYGRPFFAYTWVENLGSTSSLSLLYVLHEGEFSRTWKECCHHDLFGKLKSVHRYVGLMETFNSTCSSINMFDLWVELN